MIHAQGKLKYVISGLFTDRNQRQLNIDKQQELHYILVMTFTSHY